MTFSLVKSAKGSASTASVTPAFGSASTAGNLIVLCFAADDYNGTPDAGWTQSTGMEQQTFHGAYLWWRISAGETSFTYTIGSAVHSAWELMEFSGADGVAPYDISNGTFNQASGFGVATPTIVPSVGSRLLIGAMYADSSAEDLSAETWSGWTNSFTAIDSSGISNVGGTGESTAVAQRVVTGDGTTGYSTQATETLGSQAQSALIISFKAASAGGISLVATNIAAGAAGLGSGAFVQGNNFAATVLASAADGVGSPAPSLTAFTAVWVNTWVLDNGLAGLKANADTIVVCSQQPTDYTTASATYNLGSSSFGAGNVFPNAISGGSPNGRVLTSASVTAGSCSANGTPTYWAVLDSVNARLLATGPLTGGVAMTIGRFFTLTPVSVQLPAA